MKGIGQVFGRIIVRPDSMHMLTAREIKKKAETKKASFESLSSENSSRIRGHPSPRFRQPADRV